MEDIAQQLEFVDSFVNSPSFSGMDYSSSGSKNLDHHNYHLQSLKAGGRSSYKPPVKPRRFKRTTLLNPSYSEADLRQSYSDQGDSSTSFVIEEDKRNDEKEFNGQRSNLNYLLTPGHLSKRSQAPPPVSPYDNDSSIDSMFNAEQTESNFRDSLAAEGMRYFRCNLKLFGFFKLERDHLIFNFV